MFKNLFRQNKLANGGRKRYSMHADIKRKKDLEMYLFLGYAVPFCAITAYGAISGFYDGFKNTFFSAKTITGGTVGGIAIGLYIGFLRGLYYGLIGTIWPITVPMMMYDYNTVLLQPNNKNDDFKNVFGQYV